MEIEKKTDYEEPSQSGCMSEYHHGYGTDGQTILPKMCPRALTRMVHWVPRFHPLSARAR